MFDATLLWLPNLFEVVPSSTSSFLLIEISLGIFKPFTAGGLYSLSFEFDLSFFRGLSLLKPISNVSWPSVPPWIAERPSISPDL